MPLSTTIKYKDIFNLVMDSLNALATPILGTATTSNQVSEDPVYSEYAVMEAILASEYVIARTICNTLAHPRKVLYYQPAVTTTTSPYDIPSHLGELVSVEVKLTVGGNYFAAEPENLSVVSRLAAGQNPLSLTLTGGLYATAGSKFWFTGHTARIVYCDFAKPTSPVDASTLATLLNTNANTPDELWVDCAYIALSKILPKEGSLLGAGGYYSQLAEASLKSIETGKSPSIQFQQFQASDR